MSFPKWPSWRFGPGGQSAVFESEADVPNGWVDHPTKVDKAPKPAPPAKTPPAPKKAADKPKAAPAGDGAGLDAHGHPFDPALHAATQSKTKDGLWRMKVGVKRPDPAPGYPLDL